MTAAARYYLGIDVGTGSARAGVFDERGVLRAAASHSLQLWRPQADIVEQSSDDVWHAVCHATRTALRDSGVAAAAVRGVGFDATCSLVVLDADDRPVTVSPTGRDEQNIIVWMDHRAADEAAAINAKSHEVLRYVGGAVSVEMETPKLVWLKRHLPESWRRAARFLDLADFLTYRATGDDTRSLCTTVCKWTYLASTESPDAVNVKSPSAAPQPSVAVGWQDSYFRQIGLEDLVAEQYRRIGQRVRPMGAPVARGLTPAAAAEMGLVVGTAVGVGIIDAHAGGLGVLGARLSDEPRVELETRIALVCGTSSCHMAVAREPRFIPGVWGPYASAMVPGWWLTEGGQSATGSLIDHVIRSHARGAELAAAATSGRTVYDLLHERLDCLAAGAPFPAALTRDLHVLPYFHGNRSPRADASLRGVVSGLRLSDTVDDLALLYLATVQAIAHGTRHIIDTLNAHGYRIRTIFACGGDSRNRVFVREHADISGCRIVLPREPDAVLLGAALLGATAAGDFDSLEGAMAALGGAGEIVEPAGGVGAARNPAGAAVAAFHSAKHAVFQRMYDDFMAWRRMMAAVTCSSRRVG